VRKFQGADSSAMRSLGVEREGEGSKELVDQLVQPFVEMSLRRT
jgi:hypothetical protein